MHLPSRLPGLKGATILLAVYAVAWIALEGSLARAILLGAGAALVALGHAVQRWLVGRVYRRRLWLALAGALGVLAGFSSAVLTLIFMVLKTGLHAHGPEFSVAQIEWVLGQIPWWTSAGLLAGLGLGLILMALHES